MTLTLLFLARLFMLARFLLATLGRLARCTLALLFLLVATRALVIPTL
ncbi:MAG: hypothetical protein M0038_21335 [Pseudomonadota bacterium]|jgi:hypothetical protein|nr:hypothetical protein [Pseudomonadota bacterium]